ncbi:MAG: hypothetical protein KQH59_18310 [Desulfobulbaceae bacterium]|nr:hypothetical protein [Desulfobulbaceae bacterium]
MAGRPVVACPDCGRGEYDERHDAYYCPHHRRWLEFGCGDPRCPLCGSRHERPEVGERALVVKSKKQKRGKRL